ncbi:hypothetical protein [Pseudonocardia phyllosphaerae]|uniref:hypothetical protein n=1 Tax=Pseudonocardia phyllosphaerae TaxID=3390502 RepID=UPI00397E188C
MSPDAERPADGRRPARYTTAGLLTGLLLGIAWALGGLFGLLAAALLGVIGLAVGRYLDGGLDLSALGELGERAGLGGRGRDR